MNHLLLILPFPVALLGAGCVSNQPPPRYQSQYRTSPIWDDSTATVDRRYSSHVFRPRRIQPVYVARYARAGIPPADESSTRVYTGVSGLPEMRPLPATSQPSRLPPPRASATVPLREVPPAPRPAAFESPAPFRNAIAPSAKARLVLANRAGRLPLNQPPSAPAVPSPLAQDELPIAVPSPGRTGFANLPGHPNLPELDVRGIIPGTSVEIPDPSAPGRTIQFRVP
jgi:hypothetical protein